MTKFNPENKEVLTFGKALSPAMKITEQEDANQYLEEYIKYISKFDDITEGNTPEKIAKINLGYFAGYYDNETRKRVEKLFLCEHPIFGSIKQNGAPNDEEAFKCGYERKTLNEIRN